MEFGIALSSEEHSPRDLISTARMAEEAGFTFALISDHFHPWTSQQGNSPFVWSVLGGIAMNTETIRVGTGVTCPTIRIHPAIIAHAAATVAAMMPGRFFLGVGSGENLNEHITGARWPETEVRLEMLEEAIEVIRLLWSGENVSHRGRHYIVENARLYTLPGEEESIPVYVAAGGPKAMDVARRIGDGLITTSPTKDLAPEDMKGKPRFGKITICWADDDREAARVARHWWPNAALGAELSQELPVPKHFEEATAWVTEDSIVEHVVCGPEPKLYLEAIDEYRDAGFDHVWIHQVGPQQRGAIEFLASEVVPAITGGKV